MRFGLFFSLFCFAICLLLSGCSANPAETTQATDAGVYKLIDEAWEEDFGSQANYKIQAISPEPNELLLLDNISGSLPLTLPQAVAIATTYNRQYNTEKEDLYLAALDFTEIRHVYEPMPFFGGEATYLNDGSGNESTGLFSRYGFNQLLATGAQVGVDVGLGLLDVATGDMRSGFSSIFTAVVSQPLLRGAGRKIALENLTQGQRNILYQIRTFNRFRKSFVTSIVTGYYEVLELYEIQQNACNYYIELVKVCYRLENRAKAGRIEWHEFEQADQDRLIALSHYIQARKDYEESLDEFKIQLSISPKTHLQLDKNELEIFRQGQLSEFNLSEDEAIALAMNQRLDMANAVDIVIDADRKVDVAADAIRAELNLIGYTDVQKEPDGTRKLYQLSAQLDLPIDRLFEKNNYRRALIELMQRQRYHQELTDTVVLEVRRSYRDLKEARRRYEIEGKNLRLAQARTGHTLSLLQYNRASTRDVLDAQGDLLDAQDAATDALVDYLVAGIEFLRDTGTMKIKPDGMWEETISLREYANY
ncbi:MAG: TolC family protein [Sedimentisphaerales bacterium]|nr:TolC family protein [Sedimentisphaerales bacterium]